MVFFQFKIIINVLVNSFRFIRILMLWVYGHFFKNYFSAGTVIRFWRLNTVPVLKGLKFNPLSATIVIFILFFLAH